MVELGVLPLESPRIFMPRNMRAQFPPSPNANQQSADILTMIELLGDSRARVSPHMITGCFNTFVAAARVPVTQI
jgi:hypothetical protein